MSVLVLRSRKVSSLLGAFLLLKILFSVIIMKMERCLCGNSSVSYRKAVRTGNARRDML